MPTTAVIPVKSFAMGKQRLSGTVAPPARARLGRALAAHVATTVESAGLLPLIVTSDPEVAEWATRTGFPSLADPGNGLDAAARAGVEWVRHATGTWLVIHSDLPFLDKSDVEHLARPLEDGCGVIAPSADGGTSAIGSDELLEFSFGVCSFHRHLPRLGAPAIVVRPGLLMDVDSPLDLAAASESSRGRWLQDVLAGDPGAIPL